MAKDDATVEITYKSRELQPPLWVAGSFSNPPWTPQEMKHKTTPDGEHVFTKAIHVKPGTAVQYKFRVGSGDWWVLDESLPTVTDDMGNRNNILKVNGIESATATHTQKPPTPPPDSPTLLTAAAGLPHLQLPGGPPRSDASTPSFVKTTMEVADTASQIDARTPDSEAAEHEVPDSSIEYLDVDIGPEFPHERPGEEDDGLDAAPVFAYEYAGSYELPPGMTAAESEHSATSPSFPAQDKEQDFDPKDPTLERFPSNREDILSRVRTLETGLDEDTTTFEGFPASPVVSPGRKTSVGSIDMAGDFFSISPTNTSSRPVGSRRVEPHKRNTSRDSLVFDPSLSPSPSLQCIVEETGTDDRAGALLPEPVESDLLSPAAASKSVSPNSEAASLNSEAVSPKTTTAQLASPAIVVHETEETEPPQPVSSDHTEEHPGSFPDSDDERPSTQVAGVRSESREAATNQPRSGTPASHHSTGVEAKGNSNWFSAFIRLVFVDWLGGFLGRIFQSRRSQ